MHQIIEKVRAELAKSAVEYPQVDSQRFFKEKIQFYGLKSSVTEKIAKEYFNQLASLSKQEIFDLCEELWQSPFIEESFIACNWAYALRKQYEPADFITFDRWIRKYVNNWASCDTLCNHTVGTFIEMHPEYIANLKKYTASDNRWVRRAAAVSLIVPARRGKFLADLFEIAGLLLTDKDDMVQKGYGWMLKVASQPHQQEVFEFVVKHKATMPRTALRYAIEKMPKELKVKAMERR